MRGVVAALLFIMIGCRDDRRAIEKFADGACACKDAACAEKVLDGFTLWLKSNKLGKDDRDMKAAQRIGKCTIDAGLPLEKLQAALSGL